MTNDNKPETLNPIEYGLEYGHKTPQSQIELFAWDTNATKP